MKNLIIVESPAKARTIKNFLGKDYEVIASKGHIRDLPKHSFGIKIEDNQFQPQYRVDKDHSDIVKQIKDLAKKSDQIYIATDEDREGEAIGYHIAKAIGKDPQTLPRIVFHEITKSAIQNALENPRKINMDQVNAQQARRLLDRIVGYKLSPLLASKIQKGLSAGRVQSSALKITVDREREIQAFKPVEYWSIDALFKPEIDANLVEYKGKKIEKMTIGNEKDAREIETVLKDEVYHVKSIEKKQRKSSTPPPFMTSTLQQSASGRLSFSPKKTMMIAQKLYEGVKTDKGQMGVITYMRTDSLNIAKEAQDAARETILKTYGEDYLPEKPKIYTSKSKGAQEAHEAIRPTRLDFTPEIASKYLSADELKLYKLIYNRFLASQMTDAILESQTILFASENGIFKASGRKLLFDGFYRVMGYDDKDKLLPELKEGEEIPLEKLTANQHFTEPPPRYTEASLIKKLESLGIGRPSTYAPTISLLVSREYLKIEKRQLIPTPIAFTVIEILEKHFPEIVDSNFTAEMEEKLDEVAEKKVDWQKLLLDFYTPFIEKVEKGKKEIKSLKKAEPIGRECPECGSELLLRSGRFGEFIACSNYPKCKYTEAIEKDGEEAPTPQTTDEVCDKCGAPMVIKSGRRGSFLACSAYPKCKNTKPLEKPKSLEVKCPECGGELLERNSRRGKFFGCSNYPKCKFVSKFEPTEKKCPECDYAMAKRTFRGKEVYECIKCKHRIDA
ncbi:type I DNA topoisomerase [Hydrogenimonas thermophila]|uniref:type I DNA topoisomerase n=1 Tax=Hydrogenimonas thermophila TaxID=223786 RepID=UPI002936EE16|nr:type I DNA topoisomerase [Hydrogenimonas thermophila]WOE70060.1 type I DNA topoisomerase [Hydrogenimonas thermophila]WOE72577.1 type I DNA topoisomerase [Hydrogenimonas thermophila]